MYCRKCLNESRGKEKRVNMEVDPEGQFYICPECGHVVNWEQEEDN
jgi:rubrerythrin